MAKTGVGPMITSIHPVNQPITFVVVGAGGTGGRLLPGLMQVVRRGDTVAIVDGDHVEDRNLLRQNFQASDVGVNKAEVMMRRYRRDGINIAAYSTMLTDAISGHILSGSHRYILLGCVDNPEARQVMSKACKDKEIAWIDGGNERRGGQVILSTNHWPFKVNGTYRSEQQQQSGNYQVRGMNATPQLLESQPWHCDRCNMDNAVGAKLCRKCRQPEESCRDRIDLQTVAVNQLSASCILNVVSCLLYGVPMTTCGAFFSTLNTMSPIRLDKVNWDLAEILPEMTYATM